MMKIPYCALRAALRALDDYEQFKAQLK